MGQFGLPDGWIGAVIGLFLVLWSILIFFAPFFWWSTSRHAKDISRKLDKVIEEQQRAGTARGFE